MLTLSGTFSHPHLPSLQPPQLDLCWTDTGRHSPTATSPALRVQLPSGPAPAVHVQDIQLPRLGTFPNSTFITSTFHAKAETFLPLAPQHKEKAHLSLVPWLSEGRQIHFISILGKARAPFPHHSPLTCRRTLKRKGRYQPGIPNTSLGQ